MGIMDEMMEDAMGALDDDDIEDAVDAEVDKVRGWPVLFLTISMEDVRINVAKYIIYKIEPQFKRFSTS